MSKQSFKYPTFKSFFDCDGIACTFLKDMIKLYPFLKKEFEKISWEVERLKPTRKVYSILAIADVENVLQMNLEF